MNANNTFTDREIVMVRKLKALGIPDTVIARDFQVTPPTIGKYTYGVKVLTPKEVYRDILAEAA